MGANQSSNNSESSQNNNKKPPPRHHRSTIDKRAQDMILEQQRKFYELSLQNQRQQELLLQSEQRLQQLQSSIQAQPAVITPYHNPAITVPASTNNNVTPAKAPLQLQQPRPLLSLTPTPLLQPQQPRPLLSMPTSVPQQNRFVPSVTPSAPPRDLTEPSLAHTALRPQRDRSVSRSRGRSNNGNIDTECPTCSNVYGPRIFQCPDGHSSCESCRDRGARCGICGKMIRDVRNIALENFLSEIMVTCRNAQDGCRLMLKVADVDIHSRECPFGELRCPLHPHMQFCNWKGKLPHLSSHLKEMHSNIVQVGPDAEMKLEKVGTDNHSLSLIKLGVFHFLFHIKTCERERKISMMAQLIGTKFSAEKWNYEVHVYNKATPIRKCVYSDVCTSYIQPTLELFKESKCITLALPYAQTYAQGNSLTYKVYLRKLADKPKSRNNFQGKRRGRGGFRNNNNN